MSFNKYLKSKLSQPSGNPHYDPDGNSARAVVVRGCIGEVFMQYKGMPNRIYYEVSCFEGFNTPIGWLIQIPILIIFSPVLPIIIGIMNHKRAIASFMEEYKG
tara:strand:+ start:208 stop:516 length:309 start_codon:yes stop_codon:yes gene_type:complete